ETLVQPELDQRLADHALLRGQALDLGEHRLRDADGDGPSAHESAGKLGAGLRQLIEHRRRELVGAVELRTRRPPRRPWAQESHPASESAGVVRPPAADLLAHDPTGRTT